METGPVNDERGVRWPQVLTFYVLACAISWPFFWWRDMAPESFRAWQVPGVLKTASYMWGPGLAAIICLALFRRTHRRRITLTGTSVRMSLAFYVLPLVALAAVGARGSEGFSPHVLPLAAMGVSFLTIFGEELGWRGFLQDALSPLSPARRYLLIGVMWELWHFTNRTHAGTLKVILVRLAISYSAVILLSWLIGEAVERSRSVLVAHALHLWVDLLFEAPGWRSATVFAASLVFWSWLLRRWSGVPWRPWPIHRAAEPQARPAAL